MMPTIVITAMSSNNVKPRSPREGRSLVGQRFAGQQFVGQRFAGQQFVGQRFAGRRLRILVERYNTRDASKQGACPSTRGLHPHQFNYLRCPALAAGEFAHKLLRRL
jgi:hypothetical protein